MLDGATRDKLTEGDRWGLCIAQDYSLAHAVCASEGEFPKDRDWRDVKLYHFV